MKQILFVIALIALPFLVSASDTTRVYVDLFEVVEETLPVTVYAPTITTDKAVFVIPKIVPGTYLKVNYIRFYDDFKAYDKSGHQLKAKRKDNHFIIKEGKRLAYVKYTVKHSTSSKRVWDNTIPCGGTLFKGKRAFLINYQLITGYFEGFRNSPFQIDYKSHENLFGATALKQRSVKDGVETFVADDYPHLIDNPILFGADTASFKTAQGNFKVGVFSESGETTAKKLVAPLTKLMTAMEKFCGDLPVKDYTFLFYYTHDDSLKGPMKYFGAGSALEHLNSSVYYLVEREDSLFRNINWIGAHEYLHTWAPLQLHSEHIEHFNFDEPNMSKHLWLYEGVTDYLSPLMAEQNDLPTFQSFKQNMAGSANAAIQKKARSFTWSSQHIIKRDVFNFVSKVMQLGHFYEKGRFLAFCIDMELMMRSDGHLRLVDVVKDLNKTYGCGKPFDDDRFMEELTKRTYPEIGEFLQRHVVGKEVPDYEKYFTALGWRLWQKGEKQPSYGNMYLKFDEPSGKLFVAKDSKKDATIEFLKNDTLISWNGLVLKDRSWSNSGLGQKMYQPRYKDTLSFEVLRAGKVITVSGQATILKKLKWPIMMNLPNRTAEQKRWLAMLRKKLPPGESLQDDE